MSSLGRHSTGGFGVGDVGASSSSRTVARQPIRRSAAFDGDDEGDDRRHILQDNGHRRGVDEALVGYSRAGAEMKHRQAREKVGPLTIAKQDDGNWMEARKRRLGLDRYKEELGSLSGGLGGGKNGDWTPTGQTTDRIGHEQQHIGLQLRRTARDKEDDDVNMAAAEADADDTPPVSQSGPSPPPTQIIDDDAAARAALLSGGDSRASGADHDHFIIAPSRPLTEEEALQRDMDARPDEPTLDDYAKMPVEAFGAALLRGMGWREGMGAGKQRQGPTTAPDVRKRAALLGLGAKERQVEGGGGASDAGRRKPGGAQAHRPERRYVPVIRREGERSEQAPSSSSAKYRDRSRSPRPRDDRRERGDDGHNRQRDAHRERHRHTDDRRKSSRRDEADRDLERHSRHRYDEKSERRHHQTYEDRHGDDRRDRRARD